MQPTAKPLLWKKLEEMWVSYCRKIATFIAILKSENKWKKKKKKKDAAKVVTYLSWKMARLLVW